MRGVCPSASIPGDSFITLKLPFGRKASISTTVGLSSAALTSNPTIDRFKS